MGAARCRMVVAATLSVALVGWRRWVIARARPEWDPPDAPKISRPLAARVLGDGPPVVLLHGLGASGRYWGAEYDRLGVDRRLVVPDLLGFGSSPRPPHGYGPDEHAAAICSCLDAIGVIEPAVLVAHSAGTIVALRIAATRPERVQAVISIGPPLYPNAREASRRVARLGLMARLFANNGRLAEWTCRWVCGHRELAAHLAVLVTPRLPPAIAADGVQHSWASYSETLTELVLAGDLSAWFDDITQPVVFVAGDRDGVCDREWLRKLANQHENLRLETWPGDHQLPLTNPDAIMRLVRRNK